MAALEQADTAAVEEAVKESTASFLKGVLEETVDEEKGGVLTEPRAREFVIRATRLVEMGSHLVAAGEKMKAAGYRLLTAGLAGSNTARFWDLMEGWFGVEGTRDAPEEADPESRPSSPQPSTSETKPSSKRPVEGPSEDAPAPKATRRDAKQATNFFTPADMASMVADVGLGEGQKPIREDVDNRSVYRCCTCAYRAGNKASVCAHIRYEHTDCALVCQVCQYATWSSDTLKGHIKTKHPGGSLAFDASLALDANVLEQITPEELLHGLLGEPKEATDK